MAKNLKLNIKNNQLAEALKLNKLKKPVAKKKEASAKEPTKGAHPEAAASGLDSAPRKKEISSNGQSKAATPPPADQKEVKDSRKDSGEASSSPEQAPKQGYVNEGGVTRRIPTSSFPERRGSSPFPTNQGRQAAAPYRREGGPSYPSRERETSGRPERPVVSRPASGGGYSSTGRPPNAGYRPPFRPYPTQSGPPSAPATHRPPPRQGATPSPDDRAARKPGSFKEYRDLKPQKKGGQRSFDGRDRQGLRDTDDEAWRKRRPSHRGKHFGFQQEEVIRPKNLSVRLPIAIKELAAEMKLKASQLISKLFMQGVVVTLNDLLDDETVVQLLGHEFDCAITIDTSEEERLRITEKSIKEEIQETPAENLALRPPVITFMGHVDHGKTSLIDAIRASNIASGEAGAITQHIGAFRCHTAVGDLCILDTPGHEAFSAMRARGADVTDIVVLVIAGDEGIRTQTVEAIEQAQTAGVSLVVAINKSDKPGFDADAIYRQLADKNLLPEAWGGGVITVNCSATTGNGVKELLEMLALQAEILELKANPGTRARGSVIESEMHKGLGAVATVLVQTGTLRLGDPLVFDQHWARVKTMHDEHGKDVEEAGPSTPVKITGLSGLPEAGSEFIAVKSEREARGLARDRVLGQKERLLQQSKRAGLENLLQQRADSAEKKTLNLILRTDVQGSLEALRNSLMKAVSPKVDINIISADVGEISESDVQRAAASKAMIVGFHTQIESHADSLIKQLNVSVKLHDIIYHAIDDIRAVMKGMLDKIPQETDVGAAEVKTLFKASQLGVIAGCQVTEGTIHRNHLARLLRNGEVVWKGQIASIKRVKEDVREVSKGYECGILLQNNNEIKEGDIIQAYEITYLEQEL